ncbi:hypothetical protein L1887_29398 [Cichorium endivia]|nr:hypothetical protein L1887_29398 [Cichorium endivia]
MTVDTINGGGDGGTLGKRKGNRFPYIFSTCHLFLLSPVSRHLTPSLLFDFFVPTASSLFQSLPLLLRSPSAAPPTSLESPP